MSKRKRATIGKTPATPSTEAGVEESADDTAVKDDMVHVTPDLLAGSPDIFASNKTEATEAEPEAEPEAELAAPEVVSEPIEPPDASTTLTRAAPATGRRGLTRGPWSCPAASASACTCRHCGTTISRRCAPGGRSWQSP